MVKLLFFGVGIGAVLIAAALVLAKLSQTVPHPSYVRGPLPKCPDSPNCISSENGGFEPIAIHYAGPELIWTELQKTITAQGGQLAEVRPDYLWATFKTPFFGFIDDVEARIDAEDHVIHLRSASRVGHYDFGANRKRLLNLKAQMQVSLNPSLLKNIHD